MPNILMVNKVKEYIGFHDILAETLLYNLILLYSIMCRFCCITFIHEKLLFSPNDHKKNGKIT